MEKKELDRILASQKKRVTTQEEQLLELICDGCHKPFAETDQAALDDLCDHCPIVPKLRSLLELSAATGKIEAYGTVSLDVEDKLEEVREDVQP